MHGQKPGKFDLTERFALPGISRSQSRLRAIVLKVQVRHVDATNSGLTAVDRERPLL